MFFTTKVLLFLKTFSLNIKLVSGKTSARKARKIQKPLDQGGEYVTLLTDLSKAFDCFQHDLIITKSPAYGFDKASLRLMHSYLIQRYPRVKINNFYRLWSLIRHRVPQGSILGHILFNIFFCDMFFMVDNIDIASYADDNTPYTVGGIFLSSLGINTKFLVHACILETQALAIIFPYTPQIEKRLLMNVYFMSQFGYCPLVWINHGRTLNNSINRLHKRALSLVYNDFSSDFSDLSEKEVCNYMSS